MQAKTEATGASTARRKSPVVAVGFVAVTIAGLILRLAMLDHVTADYSFFLKGWIAQLMQYEGLSGLGQSIGEYNVPYMLFLAIVGRTPFNDLYEIKLLSILFDYIGAFAILKILAFLFQDRFFTPKQLLAYAIVLLDPVFFLDSAFWAQCDMIYTALCLLCLLCLLKEHYHGAMLLYGLAISVKLQAIFFFPVLVILFFTAKRLRIWHFLWIPAVFLAAALPAILAGRGVVDTLSIYFAQTSIYQSLTMACPNLFALWSGDYGLFSKIGILLAFAVLGIGLLILRKQGMLENKRIVLLAAWSAMVCIYFLPAMHERYPFMACVFVILWAFIEHRDAWIALGVNFVCLMSYLPYLFQITPIDMTYLAIANLVFLLALTVRLFWKPRKKIHT